MSEHQSGATLRVGLVCHHGVGGSVQIAVGLAAELALRGHEVHLFARSAPLGLSRPPPGVTLHVLHDVAEPGGADGVTTGLDLDWPADELAHLVARICSVARAVGLDVLHFHYAVPFAEVLYAVRRRLGTAKPALVGTLHGTDVSMLGPDSVDRRALGTVLTELDALTTVSHDHAALATTVFGPAVRPGVIPDFVDLTRFRPPRRGRNAGRSRLIHVSNFRAVKQPESMARIADAVMARTDAELWLVGDGETMPAVAAILVERAAEGRVRRFGVRLDVEQVVPHADLLLVTSSAESFCLVALEAMASGVAVAAPRVGGLPELIEHDVSGLLFDDEAEAARLVCHYLADPAQRRRLRTGGLARARDLAATAVVPLYEQLYHEVVAARTGTGALAVPVGG